MGEFNRKIITQEKEEIFKINPIQSARNFFFLARNFYP